MKNITILVLFLLWTTGIFAQKDGDDISIGKYRIIHSGILDDKF